MKETERRILFTKPSLIKIVFVLMFLSSLLYLILGEIILPNEEKFENECKILDVDWYLVEEGKRSEAFTIPCSYPEEKEQEVTIEGELPVQDLEGKYILCWTQGADMQIFINGELRETYNTKKTRLLGSSSASKYIMLGLREDDIGKTIRITTLNHEKSHYNFREIYIGNTMGLWLKVLEENTVAIAASVLVFILGLAALAVSLGFEGLYNRKIPLKHLSVGVIIVAIWLIANATIRQLFFPNVSVIHDTAYIMVMLIGMPFLFYMDTMQEKRYTKFYMTVEILIIINFFVANLLVILLKWNYSQTFNQSAICDGASILVIIVTVIIDIVKKRVRPYLLSAIGILGFCFCSLLQIVCFLFQLKATYSGIVMVAGIIFLLGISFISMIIDTEKTQHEKDKAILASKSQAKFLANMSHEIRTPINAVLGMNEMILREEKDPQIRSYAQDIQSAGKTLLSLINDILDLSKIESGKMEIVPVDYDVSSLLNDCYNLVVKRARDKGLLLEYDCNLSIPRRLFGDEVRIRQIIINFLTNAIKYTDAGKVNLSLDYRREEEDKIILIIRVKDTGQGITPEDQKKIFDSFQRVKEEQNRNIEGTGLGLSITKQLLDLMQGTVLVDSVYGQGSTFTVEIPQKIVIDEPVGENLYSQDQDEMPVVEQEVVVYPDCRTLIVDDVSMNLRVMEGLLKRTKIKIDTAISGKECLNRVCQKKYDIIFLDHMMPDLDGIETLKRMHMLEGNLNQDTPVIMLTANAISGAREEYLQAGFTDYLAKPVDGKHIENMLKKYLPEECHKSNFSALQAKYPFLDVEIGMGFSGGNEEFYEEILAMFVEGDKTKDFEQCLEQKDWQHYQRHAHGLKGTAGAIGAMALSKFAAEMEEAAGAGQEEKILTYHVKFMELYHKVLDGVSNAGKQK